MFDFDEEDIRHLTLECNNRGKEITPDQCKEIIRMSMVCVRSVLDNVGVCVTKSDKKLYNIMRKIHNIGLKERKR